MQDAIGVTLGCTLGHVLCTGIAVVGGRLIAQRISVRMGWLPFIYYFIIYLFIPFQ
jgi:putative Ca2+/H+ antiporter (TMEM165/GDT1 family)